MDMKPKLLSKISDLTLEIQTNYPELYKYLQEIPITIPSEHQTNVDNESLQNYLEDLEEILKDYKLEYK